MKTYVVNFELSMVYRPSAINYVLSLVKPFKGVVFIIGPEEFLNSGERNTTLTSHNAWTLLIYNSVRSNFSPLTQVTHSWSNHLYACDSALNIC